MDTAPRPATDWLDAHAAAALLGVRRATLYAYVSRGLLTAHADPARRASRYHRAEVERLARDRQAVRRPRDTARQTLDWGLPVLRSSLTLIDGGRLYYRGQDAVTLSASAGLEDVAALLWGGTVDLVFGAPEAPDGLGAARRRPPRAEAAGLAASPPPPSPTAAVAAFAAALATPPARGQGTVRQPPAVLAEVPAGSVPAPAADDEAAHADRRACAVLLRTMAGVLLGRSPASAIDTRPLHRQLQSAWQLDDAATDHVRAALVLCADHELNASSFTARCVASTGADLGVAVLAGLAALSGPLHGGMTDSVERWWDAVDAAGGFARWQRRGGDGARRPLAERLPWFGHPLYPQGDPRAAALLACLPLDAARTRLLSAASSATGLRPSLDLGLVALRRSLGLPRGAAFMLFALGRTAGWLAHALEQRAERQLIRPRAAYVGARPPAAPAVAIVGHIVRRR